EDRPDQRFPHPSPFVLSLDREIGLDRCDPAIKQDDAEQNLAPRPAGVALIVRDQPTSDGEAKDDQGDRDRFDQEIAQTLRRYDVDVAKAEDEQKRLAK